MGVNVNNFTRTNTRHIIYSLEVDVLENLLALNFHKYKAFCTCNVYVLYVRCTIPVRKYKFTPRTYVASNNVYLISCVWDFVVVVL